MAKIKFNPSQEKIINHREGNMIVAASAGSGKTTVMLERVIRIVQEGTPIDRIVILAFNNSIAAEIRGKMYASLVEKLNDESCTAKEFIKEQIDRLPFCNIITNDSYCKGRSSEFFQILGIDPNADILGDVEKNILFRKNFDLALNEFKESANGEIFELSLKFGGDSKLFDTINIINSYVSTQAGGMEWLDSVVNGVYTQNITKSTIMDYLFELVTVRLNYTTTLLAEIVEIFKGYPEKSEVYSGYIEFFNELKNVKDYDNFYKMINAFTLISKQRPSKKYEIDWDLYKQLNDDLKLQISELKGKFTKSIDEAQNLHESTIGDIKLLVELYKKTKENYDNCKEISAKYDFTDFTANLIKLLNNTDIQREIANRYDYICVDEYQDTNYAQEEIYTNISNGNNLFMVGDSKQSIYRFRLSEPKILLEKFNDYNQNKEHGETVMLDNNYRSDKGIVEFVNIIFNDIMTKDFGGIDYKETDQLKYGADYKIPPVKPSYEIHLFDSSKEKEEKEIKTFDKVYSVKDDECGVMEISPSYNEGLFIAKKITEIVNNYTVYDPKIKDTRKVQFSDIALLSRTGKDNVREIVKALQDNFIPIDISPLLKVEGVYEIELIKDILRLVVNDMQDLQVAAVLVSYFVGMDYDDLLALREKYPTAEYFWQAVQAEKNSNEYVIKLYSLINDLRLKSSYMSIKELADYVVFGYGFDKYVLSEDGGDYKLSAIKTYLGTLEDLSVDCSLYEYVSTLTADKMEIKGGADGNTVKAMTIHKSKGLEFPVVFVCNIEKKLTMKGGLYAPKLLINKDAGIAINYFDEDKMVAKRNLAFDILKEKNQFDDKAEAMRLFYVALTRPKNHIILTGTAKESDLYAKNPFDIDSFLDWIMVAAKNNSELNDRIQFHSEEIDSQNVMQRYSFSKYHGKDMPIIDKYINFVYSQKKAENTSIKYTVTEINKQGGKNYYIEEDEETCESDLDITIFDRAKRGTNYHTILENIDFNAKTYDSVVAELERMVRDNIIAAQDLSEIDVQEIVSIMNTSVMEYARANKCYREQPFTLYVNANEVMDTEIKDKVFVEGAIDLLIVGEEVWIVDYKKSDEPSAILKERYKKQLELYSTAVQKAIGRKVNKAMLLVIGRSEVIDINIDWQ